jgi:iron complex outermembrane receptor protein
MFHTIRLSHLLLSSVALSGFAGAPVAAQAQSAPRQFMFDVPAQPLGDALLAFSRRTGLQLASSPSLLKGARGQRLRGRMTAEEALARLTAGSELDGRIVDGTVTVVRHMRFATAEASAPAVALGGATAQVTGTSDVQLEDGTDIVVTGYRARASPRPSRSRRLRPDRRT